MSEIEVGDWVDLRVEVTRKDENSITVWLRGAGQHVTMHKDSVDIVGRVKRQIPRDKPD